MKRCPACGTPTNRKAITRLPFETLTVVSRTPLCAQCHHALVAWHKTEPQELQTMLTLTHSLKASSTFVREQ